jgi:hypothetical protein
MIGNGFEVNFNRGNDETLIVSCNFSLKYNLMICVSRGGVITILPYIES